MGAAGFDELKVVLPGAAMQTAPMATNEAERLAAVRRYDVSDGSVNAALDEIAKLAAYVCGVPIGVISLVEEEQQLFISRCGTTTAGTPREESFCAHAILQHGLLEVPDTTKDPRFFDSPSVTGQPHLRFYAGQPLVTPDGLALGTLCVMDRVPRTLTREQREALRTLARQAASQLELRRITHGERQANAHLQRQIEQRTDELRETEELFRMMVAGVTDHAIIILDPEGHVVTWNPGAERAKGYSAEEIVGKHVSCFYSSEDRAAGAPELALQHARATGAFQTEGWRVRKDGTRSLDAVTLTALRDDDGRLRGFAELSRDVTERRQTAAALAESEERFRQLAEQSSDVFWFVSLNPERVSYVSPAGERLFGVSADAFYSGSLDLLSRAHPDDWPGVAKAYAATVAGRTARFEAEYRVLHPNGALRWVSSSGTAIRDASGAIIRVAGITKDITEARHATAERLRMQRLESIGTLSSGIAHDLNNALAPILMGLELLRTSASENISIIDTMTTSARHGAAMVKQLVTFAKGVDGARVLIQPRHLFNDIGQIIRSTFPKNIDLKIHCPARLDPLLGDPTQLHQVLLNLCVNARDAMPHGGTLTLSAESRDLDETDATATWETMPGGYVVWHVADTGTGIRPDILERIFDPFFTTKSADKGSGLGLSTARGIVKSHGGFVRVSSTLNEGSKFSVYLPRAEQDERGAPLPEAPTPALRGNGETVLVVDDVADVRHASRAVLTALNFNVLTASDGAEALVLATQHRRKIRAVLTDQHMPRMDGLSLVRALKHILPHAGIIVASGRLSEREALEFEDSLGVTAILEKPFTQEKLVEALIRGLEHSSRNPAAN